MRGALAALSVAAALTLTPIPNLTPAAAAAVWRPRPGPVFNDPTGDDAAQNRIVHRLNEAIRHIPRGATMRLTSMTLSIDSTTDALVNAHQRGVNVRVVLPVDKRDQPDATRLRNVLGSDYRHRSWLRFCSGSCYRDGTHGVMHAKVFTASRTGAGRYVTMTTSGNLDASHTRDKFNDAYTTVGRESLYRRAVAYVERMRTDGYERVPAPVTSGSVGMRFFPRTSNPFQTALDNTHCTGPVRTRVRLTTSLWDGTRAGVARRLAALHHAGCDVKVLVQSYRTTSQVAGILRAGHVPTRRADHNGHGNHTKALAVSGHYGGQLRANVVLAGSVNLTSGDSGCDNQMVRMAAFGAYARNFTHIWRLGAPLDDQRGVTVTDDARRLDD